MISHVCCKGEVHLCVDGLCLQSIVDPPLYLAFSCIAGCSCAEVAGLDERFWMSPVFELDQCVGASYVCVGRLQICEPNASVRCAARPPVCDNFSRPAQPLEMNHKDVLRHLTICTGLCHPVLCPPKMMQTVVLNCLVSVPLGSRVRLLRLTQLFNYSELCTTTQKPFYLKRCGLEH
jgi:hypothetical protein